MFVMNSTVLREVLLIWMPYRSISSLFLNVAVHAGGADGQRGARRVKRELVGAPGGFQVVPAGLVVVVVVDAGLAVRRRHHVRHPQEAAALEQGMVQHLLAQAHRQFELALDQLVAFQFHLPAAHVQRGQDLVVGRGRGVGHVGFVEGLFDLVLEVLVPHMDRSLAQRGQRLVGGWRTRAPAPGGVGQQHRAAARRRSSRCRRRRRHGGGRRPDPVSASRAALAMPVRWR